MTFHFTVCAVSLAVLAWSASGLVANSAALALRLRINPALIGLTVIALGTSAPELVVSLNAAATGHGELVLGNVLGSNIANASIALVPPLLLAGAALPACRSMALPLAAVTGATALLLLNYDFSRLDSLLLLALLLPCCWWMMKTQSAEAELAEQGPKQRPIAAQLGLIALSLAGLLLAAHFLVNSAVTIALNLGISEQLVGLTLVAVGTSLPEIAAATAAARQNATALVLSNLIGSNLLNLLMVLGSAGVVAPLQLNPQIAARDLTALGLFSAALILIALRPPAPGLARPMAALLLMGYLGYLGLVGHNEGIW